MQINSDFLIILITFSLQKDPLKRASAGALMTHPFITRYSEFDGDLIIWLKEYLEV